MRRESDERRPSQFRARLRPFRVYAIEPETIPRDPSRQLAAHDYFVDEPLSRPMFNDIREFEAVDLKVMVRHGPGVAS